MKGFATGILVMAAALPTQSSSSSVGDTKLYVLHDPAKDVWCGYDDASRWRKDIDSVMALEVANVEYIDKHPRRISLTTEDPPEAGDWMIDDTYTLNEVGEVLSLKRETRVLPGDARRIEKFERLHGKVVRTSVSTNSLTSGHPIDSKQITFPSYSVSSSVSKFPFSELLNSQDVSEQNRLCVKPNPVVSK